MLSPADHRTQNLHAFLGTGGTAPQQAAIAVSEAQLGQQHGTTAADGQAARKKEGTHEGPVHHLLPATAAVVATENDAHTGWPQTGIFGTSSLGGVGLTPTSQETLGAAREGHYLPAVQHQRLAHAEASARRQHDAGSSCNFANVCALLTEAESRPHAGKHKDGFAATI